MFDNFVFSFFIGEQRRKQITRKYS